MSSSGVSSAAISPNGDPPTGNPPTGNGGVNIGANVHTTVTHVPLGSSEEMM